MQPLSVCICVHIINESEYSVSCVKYDRESTVQPLNIKEHEDNVSHCEIPSPPNPSHVYIYNI